MRRVGYDALSTCELLCRVHFLRCKFEDSELEDYLEKEMPTATSSRSAGSPPDSMRAAHLRAKEAYKHLQGADMPRGANIYTEVMKVIQAHKPFKDVAEVLEGSVAHAHAVVACALRAAANHTAVDQALVRKWKERCDSCAWAGCAALYNELNAVIAQADQTLILPLIFHLRMYAAMQLAVESGGAVAEALNTLTFDEQKRLWNYLNGEDKGHAQEVDKTSKSGSTAASTKPARTRRRHEASESSRERETFRRPKDTDDSMGVGSSDAASRASAQFPRERESSAVVSDRAGTGTNAGVSSRARRKYEERRHRRRMDV